MLLGLVRPTEGGAEVLGCSIQHPARYAARVGALVEGPAFVPGLSARANLLSLARLRGLPSSRSPKWSTPLASSRGLVAGLSAAASMFGVVTLSFWALVTAGDYTSGLIRLLVAAQPLRWKLLVGKLAALCLLTVVATTVALAVNVGAAPAAAGAAGIDTTAWRADASASMVVEAWGNALLASLVWGVVGPTLAVALRSSALAISIGVGWVLVVECVVKSAFDGGGSWLPGTVLTALAHGGDDLLAYPTALGLGLAYVVVGVGAAMVVGWRRDITDRPLSCGPARGRPSRPTHQA